MEEALERQIEQWRSYLRRRQAIHAVDVAELEDHLREQVAGLLDAGLDADEAFLVAVKRMGNLDALSREFAREHSERLWKQLVLSPADSAAPGTHTRHDAIIVFCFALGAAAAIKIPSLFGHPFDIDTPVYLRNASLLVLPLLAAYFAWKRRLQPRTIGVLAIACFAMAIFANAWPFTPRGFTEVLTGLHVPIVLWTLAGIAYAGERWKQVAGRMDFIRFSGEFVIYFTLIAIGGVVLTMSLALIFNTIGIDVERFIESWLLPCGAAGAVLVAAWLVEAKQSVIENMAPVLTRLFTPLFAMLLLVFLATLLWTGGASAIHRDFLLAFDALLIVVLALLLYSVSARDPELPPRAFDVMQVVLVASALAADAVALWAIAGRITDYGFSPNRTAVLGINLILLINLAWSAVLYIRFLRGRVPFTALERWQTSYLPVYAVWAAIVVIVFPPLFSFV